MEMDDFFQTIYWNIHTACIPLKVNVSIGQKKIKISNQKESLSIGSTTLEHESHVQYELETCLNIGSQYHSTFLLQITSL
jgi:hypothetical protein